MNLETEISPELWAAVRRSYESQSWSNAILDGIYHLSDVIRAKTGLQSDGTALVGQAFGGTSPKLRLNKLQTDSEKNIQAGVEQLLRGLYQAIRNPRSHDRMEDSRVDADSILLFVSYLIGVIGLARTQFSLEECVGQILEENFVPTRRYAELIIQDIPQRQRLQVVLTVLQKRSQTDGRKLKEFFQAAIASFDPEGVEEFFEVVSNELRDSSDEAGLRTLLQILEPSQWNTLREVARLRTENRLIRNVQDGRYARARDKCNAGALATWSRAFWPHFTLKEELLTVVMEKLESSSAESQDYVLKYTIGSIDCLIEQPTPRLERLLLEKLKAGDERFYEAVTRAWLWSDNKWSSHVTEALNSFTAAETTEDDDIPF